MIDSALPVEILDMIVKNVTQEYTVAKPRVRDSNTFLPHWYLLPVLRVCKLWYMVAEKYLYESISVGSSFPPGPDDNSLPAGERRRLGRRIADDLRATLRTNARLAAMVRELQLGTSDESSDYASPSAAIGILQLCPNLEHVAVYDLDVHDVAHYRSAQGSLSQVLVLMQAWPKLRTIKIDDFLKRADSARPLASQALNCCPDVREIDLAGAPVGESDLKALRLMCTSVAKLTVAVVLPVPGTIGGEATLDALCDCLRAWSSTLECVKLIIREGHFTYRPLYDAISALTGLRELQIDCPWLDLASFSDLPHLERLLFSAYLTLEEPNLVTILENPEKFPALRLLATCSFSRAVLGRRLDDVCLARNITFLHYRLSPPGFYNRFEACLSFSR